MRNSPVCPGGDLRPRRSALPHRLARRSHRPGQRHTLRPGRQRLDHRRRRKAAPRRRAAVRQRLLQHSRSPAIRAFPSAASSAPATAASSRPPACASSSTPRPSSLRSTPATPSPRSSISTRSEPRSDKPSEFLQIADQLRRFEPRKASPLTVENHGKSVGAARTAELRRDGRATRRWQPPSQ